MAGFASNHSSMDHLDARDGEILENSNLNLTALRMAVNQMSPWERDLLRKQLDVDSLEQLLFPSVDSSEMTYEEKLMAYPDYRLRKVLLLYIPPILVILGSFGNILSFIILMRRSMRQFSTYVYLAVLSITDTLILLIGLLPLWIGELTGLVIRDQSDWICKLSNVAGYTASDYSVWLIIAVTVERYIAVCHPLKAPTICKRNRAVMVIVGVFLVLFAINLHFFWTVVIHEYKQNGYTLHQCEGAPSFTHLVQVVWPWVDAFLYSFLPFIIITVLNFLIIRQVVQARRERKRMQWTAGSNNTTHRSQETGMKLTVMLLTISFAFLLTTLPMNISMIGSAFYAQYQNEYQFVARFKLVQSITELLMYVNHSMNFYLYCATGQKFRQQLLLLFCHRSHLSQHSSKTLDKTKVSKRQNITSFSARIVTNKSNKTKQVPFDQYPPKTLLIKKKDHEEYIPMSTYA